MHFLTYLFMISLIPSLALGQTFTFNKDKEVDKSFIIKVNNIYSYNSGTKSFSKCYFP